MRHLLALLIALSAQPATAQRYGDPSRPIAAINDLDLTRYLGRWYEIARFPNRFERGCAAVTADYALMPDGTISVRNTCHEGAVDGPVEVAQGSARVEGPGRLSVNFVRFLPFLRGDYWVLDVTPDYGLAVVGEPGRDYGWVLARAPQITEAEYDRALSVLTANGYDVAQIERVAQP